MKKFFSYLFQVLLYAFAFIGLLFTVVFFGMKFGAFNVRGSSAERNQFFGPAATALASTTSPVCTDTAGSICPWDETAEWQVISDGLQKDASVIQTVSQETGVPSRMIVATVIPEQTRFFTANREIFKNYFEPLEILGSETEFSLGVSGIREATADDIEQYANDPTSQFYPGPGLSGLFAYAPGTSHDTELFDRLTDPKNHYYQYLYTALFIKEVENQWANAGYPINQDPEVVVTLFNLGFGRSYPKADPKVGGSTITTGGQPYLYGQLGTDFYNSTDLIDIFPVQTNS